MPQVFDKDLQKTWQVPNVTSGHAGAPVATSDVSAGFSVGDVWIMTSNAIYMCAVNAKGAAVWTQIG